MELDVLRFCHCVVLMRKLSSAISRIIRARAACRSASVGIFAGFARPLKTRYLKRSRVFAFLELAMKLHQKLSKTDERELLRTLAERRQRSTPNHRDPAWMVAAYRRMAS